MLCTVLPLLFSFAALSLGQTVYNTPCTATNTGTKCSCFVADTCANALKIDIFGFVFGLDCTDAAALGTPAVGGPCQVAANECSSTLFGQPNNCGSFSNFGITPICCAATPPTDLAISMTDGVTTVTPGLSITYTIVATNNGPNAADNSVVTDTFPAALTGCTWTCTGGMSGAVCASASGSGNINVAITTFPVNGVATISATCTIAPSATSTLINTATVTAPTSTAYDANLSNNVATDIDCLPCINGVCSCAQNCLPQPDGTRCDDGRGTTHTDICVDNTCTSCADRKQCADPKDISLTLPDGQLICGDVATSDSNCRAPNLKINGWIGSAALSNINGQSVTLSDFMGCFAPIFANNTLVGFTNAANGRSIVFSRNGQCWLKFIKPIVNTKRNTLQATTTVTISAAHLLPAVGGATGDPHITGPRGEHFEFQGRRAARYTMISGPKYFINAQMSVEQGDVHFMTQVHVRVGDVEFTAAQLSLFDATEKDLAPLNAKLAPHSANVTVVNRRHNGIVPLPPQLVLNLCGGQERIIVTAVKPSQRQVTAFHLFETTLYYNIEFEVAGCHDELDGVIGQLYQCKYNAQPFVYDAAVVEQRFAVENFDDVPDSFKPRASCLRLQAHEDIVGGVAAFK